MTPVERQCGFCLWNRCDTKGNHATMCTGGASCHQRHNEVRSVLAKALDSAGFETGYEHSGGLHDERKPGDIIAYNWNGSKHLLVDVSIVNPLAPTYRKHLQEGGPGQAASSRETRKRAKYWDLDKDKYEFHPFILESTGAFGPSALNLCATIKKITKMKSCIASENPEANDNSESVSDNHTIVDPLPASISVVVQRHNAQMILERQPPPAKLLAAGIEKCSQAAARIKKWAKKKLRSALCGNGPVSRMEWDCQPVTTFARSSAQDQPTHWTAPNTAPKTSHQASKMHIQLPPNHPGRDPDLKKHDTNHPVRPEPVRPEPQHQKQLPDSVPTITPLPEAHITQKINKGPRVESLGGTHNAITPTIRTRHTRRRSVSKWLPTLC